MYGAVHFALAALHRDSDLILRLFPKHLLL
jgi:hypothetical protein